MGEPQEAPPPRAGAEGAKAGWEGTPEDKLGELGERQAGMLEGATRGRRKGKRNDRWEKSEKTDAKWDCIGSTLRLIKHHCDALCKLESTTQM